MNLEEIRSELHASFARSSERFVWNKRLALLVRFDEPKEFVDLAGNICK